jgi:hypothetical protein
MLFEIMSLWSDEWIRIELKPRGISNPYMFFVTSPKLTTFFSVDVTG